MRTSVYIDGFNLNYGAVKGTPLKWLDPKRLLTRVPRPNHEIRIIKYFTARISGAVDANGPRRQHAYLRALGTIPEIEIHYGRFLAKTIWRPLVNLPITGRIIQTPMPVSLPSGTYAVTGSPPQSMTVGRYSTGKASRRKSMARPAADAIIIEAHSMEEKGSDVNLAAHLLNDAWKGLYEAAVVVSNDTDLVEPIRMVTVERGLPVTVVCPGRWPIAPQLAGVATHARHIRRRMLVASQFPNPIPGTTIFKPHSW